MTSKTQPLGPGVALAHDWMTGFRGGERVLEAFCELFPEAPIYTLIHVPGATSPTIERHSVHTSFLNRVPGIGESYRKFLPLFPLAVDRMRIQTHSQAHNSQPIETLLSSSHCVIKGLKKPAGAVHVSYVHSPMRYMYDQYDHYFGADAPLLHRVGARVFRSSLVKWDRASNHNVDLMLANSKFVQARIRKYYEIDSEVVYPFVDFSDFARAQTPEAKGGAPAGAETVEPSTKSDYFVMVTAFAPNKRVDLAIEAFNRLRLKLVIIGSGQLESQLRSIAGPTIEFRGSVSRPEVVATLRSARALVFPGIEDFGITPLEALASNTPVIAFRAGGVLETLTEDDTVFFDQLSIESLVDAVQRFDRARLSIDRSRLQVFSRERFQREILEKIEQARLAKC